MDISPMPSVLSCQNMVQSSAAEDDLIHFQGTAFFRAFSEFSWKDKIVENGIVAPVLSIY